MSHEDASYSDSSLSDTEWTDIDFSSSHPSDESGSEGSADDFSPLAEQTISGFVDWESISGDRGEQQLVTSLANVASTSADLPPLIPVPIPVDEALTSESTEPSEPSEPSSAVATSSSAFGFTFPDPLENTGGVGYFQPEEEYIPEPPDNPWNSPSHSVAAVVPDRSPPMNLPSVARLQIVFHGYTPPPYKREALLESIVRMVGREIEPVVLSLSEPNSSIPSTFPTLVFVFLNPPLPTPSLPFLPNGKFLPVLMPGSPSGSGSGSILDLSMSSLLDFSQSQSSTVDRGDLADNEWESFQVPASSVLDVATTRNILKLADLERGDERIAQAVRDLAIASQKPKSAAKNLFEGWVARLLFSVVAILLGSAMYSSVTSAFRPVSSPAPVPASPQMFWLSRFRPFGNVSSPSVVVSATATSTALPPALFKDFTLSIFSSDPLKLCPSAQKLSTGSATTLPGPTTPIIKWAKQIDPVLEEQRLGRLTPTQAMMAPVESTTFPELLDAQEPRSLGQVIASAISVSYQSLVKVLVADLCELLNAFDELFETVKKYTILAAERTATLKGVVVDRVRYRQAHARMNVKKLHDFGSRFVRSTAVKVVNRHHRAMRNARAIRERVLVGKESRKLGRMERTRKGVEGMLGHSLKGKSQEKMSGRKRKSFKNKV